MDTHRQALPPLMRMFCLSVCSEYEWPKNESVYQYTTYETLRRMLGGGELDADGTNRRPAKLWATSSLHLNDSE